MKAKTVADELVAELRRKHIERVKADPKRALRNLRKQMAYRRQIMLDPNYGRAAKAFPQWVPGMHTEEYINQFVALDLSLLLVKFNHRRGPAPFNEETA